jgi:hypothetical protein
MQMMGRMIAPPAQMMLPCRPKFGLRRLSPSVEQEVEKMPILNDIMDHEVIGPAILKELEKGRLEGLKEGLKEGQQMGSQNILRRQLERRFGALPEWASKEHAQDGHGIKRPAGRASVFPSSLAARSRALCAFEEDAQNGHGVKLATERASEFLSHLAARSRALCASKRLAEISAAELEEIGVRILEVSDLEHLFPPR